MKKFFGEFKKFALRGNVIDMAIGIIMGGAFGKIVSSLVSDVIMPFVGLLIGGVNFTDLKVVLKKATVENGIDIPAVTINYGNFIQSFVDFVIIAFFIFLMVKTINDLSRKKDETPTTPPEPSEEVKLLTQIRDLLEKEKEK